MEWKSEEEIGGGKVSTQHLEGELEKASFSIRHGKRPRPISGNISDQTVCESANTAMKENQGPTSRDGTESTFAQHNKPDSHAPLERRGQIHCRDSLYCNFPVDLVVNTRNRDVGNGRQFQWVVISPT